MRNVRSAENPGNDGTKVSRRQLLGLPVGISLLASGCVGTGSPGDRTTGSTDRTAATTTSRNRTAATTSTGQSDRLPPPVRGDPDADVTVAAYVDFACPHCRNYELDTLPKLVDDYVDPGVIRYEHRDFPVPVDVTASWEAASAARAVQVRGGQDAFWEFARTLFEDQQSLSPGLYEEAANDLGLDGAAVREASVDEQYRATVEADKRRGEERRVYGTPTIVVNGSPVASESYSLLERVIEAKRAE